VDPRFILNNELWDKFLLGHIGIVREVLQKMVLSSSVSILDTIWQTLCSCAEMHKIFIAQKSYCACRVLSLATIRSKYYFNFIVNRTRSGRELFYRPCNSVFSALEVFYENALYKSTFDIWQYVTKNWHCEDEGDIDRDQYVWEHLPNCVTDIFTIVVINSKLVSK